MRVNSEFVSNEIDESDPQFEKHREQRIWTRWGINSDGIRLLSNARESIRVTSSAADGTGLKTGEGMIMPPCEPNSKSDLVTVADHRKMRRVTLATNNEVSSSWTRGETVFDRAMKIESCKRLGHMFLLLSRHRALIYIVSTEMSFCSWRQLVVLSEWRIKERWSSRFEECVFWANQTGNSDASVHTSRGSLNRETDNMDAHIAVRYQKYIRRWESS
jgi:hypothetical protein